MDDPEVFQGKFLFVNKNATNLKSRSSDEAFTIGSHVFGRYARWRKIARVKPRQVTHFVQPRLPRIPPNSNDVDDEKNHISKAAAKRVTGVRNDEKRTTIPRSRTDSAPCSSTTRSVMRRPPESSTLGRNREAEVPQGSAGSDSKHTLNPSALSVRSTRARIEQYSELLNRSLQSSLRSPLQKGNSDPFSAAVLPITPFMALLINVWQGVYLETVWPIDAGAAWRVPALLSWQNDCRDMIANKARLHGLLTWTLMLQIRSLPESPNRAELLLQFLSHKNKCLESLRRDLSQGANNLSMVPVLWHLTGAEFYSGDLNTATVHFTALKAMVESCGGLQALPWALRTLVVVADMTLSQVKMEHPLFSTDQWDPGSIFAKLSNAEAQTLARSPHLTGNPHLELPESVTDIFRDYQELLAVYELVEAIPNGARRTELLCWAQRRQYALNSRVTKRRIDITAAPIAKEQRTTELCTCVAVDYFQQLIWRTRHKARTKHVPFHHPRPSFDDLLPNKGLVSPHLSLWIYLLAATVEQIDDCRSQRKGTGHAHRFFALTRKFGLRLAQDLRRIFNDFLYHSETLDPYLIALLAKAEEPLRGTEEVTTQSTRIPRAYR
jgi:hypothetical protein